MPSIIVDDDLLKDISKILENEKNERQIQHEKLISKLISEFENQGYDHEDAKYKAQARLHRPHINLYYKLKSNDGRIRTYSSIDELLEQKHVYNSILWIEMDISHYNDNYNDINIRMDNEREYIHGSCEIKGSDEGKLHKIETDLKGKFKSKKTEYSWLYESSFKNKIRISIITSGIILVPIIIPHFTFKPGYEVIGPFLLSIAILMFFLFLIFPLWELIILDKIKSMHPYFYFKLGNDPQKPSNLFKYINKIIIGVLVALIVAMIISLFQYFKQLLFGG